MKKAVLLLVLLLMLGIQQSWAQERWVFIGESKNQPVYYDSLTVQRCKRFTGANCSWAVGNDFIVSGGSVTSGYKAWVLAKHSETPTQITIDCQRRQTIESLYGIPRDIEPQSPSELLYTRLCRNKLVPPTNP